MKKKKVMISYIVSHIFLLLLVILIFLPGEKQTKGPEAFLGAIAVIEVFYIKSLIKSEKKQAVSDIVTVLWIFLISWELLVTKLNLLHPVLIPSPENVFYVFPVQYKIIITGVISSLKLLLTGLFIGLFLGNFLGVICGWIPRLRDMLYPIANVLSPIPPVVYSPYIIALMPSFRSASAMIVILGIFWPNFLNMIIRVNAMNKNILDSARVLRLDNFNIIFKILLPYSFPGIINGLKVTVTTAVMMLTMAEMMGATSGMGYYIVNYNTYGNYTNVVAGIIVVGIVVIILNKLVCFIQSKLIKWN